jgi:eukaryotic-like serine/threonine-protein kinase
MKFDIRKYKTNTLGGLLLHLLLASALILLIAVTYFYAYLPNATNHGETITVPNIEGLDSKKAEEFLTRHDLRFEVNDSSYSSQYPALTVLKQFPSAGAKVKENRKIYVSVNRINPPTVPMPDLINGSLINAEAVLKGSELKRGKIQLVRGPWLNLVQEMKIKGNKVEPNVRVPKGTVVDLVVMDGGGMNVPAPNVLNYSYDEADFSIKGSLLSVGNVTLVGGDTTGMKPVVLKQKPGPGENIRVGDVVDLWVGAPDTTLPDDDDSDGN